MVHGLLNLLTHATFVDHDNVALSEIVQGEDLSKSCQPCIKGPPWRSLSLPHTLPGKASSFRAVEERLDLEQTFFRRTHQSLSSLPLLTLTECCTWKKEVHLPIMRLSSKVHVLLLGIAQNLQIFRNRRVLCRGYIKKGRESYLESHIPTPHVMPKANLGPIPHFESGTTWESLQTFSNIFSQPHPKGSCGLKGAPTPPPP